MWIALALLSALGSALTSLTLKQAVVHGGAVVSTVVFRAIGGALLAAVVAAWGAWPELTPGYWRAACMMIPPEVGGMLFLTLALRAGDLSLVQPIMGVLPLFVMVGGAVFLQEIPTPLAAVGVVLVTVGVYVVGLQKGGSLLEPLRNLMRSRASWYAVGASVMWSITTVVHKLGIAEVGPFPWAVTLALGSAAALALALPVMAWRTGSVGWPARLRTWAGLVAAAGLLFAIQQGGLHLSLRLAHAGYVVALTAVSVLLATGMGIVFLGERTFARNRIAGGVFVCCGTVLIALFG